MKYKNLLLRISLVIILLLSVFDLSAQRNRTELTRILFLFDASGSMNGTWDDGIKLDNANYTIVENSYSNWTSDWEFSNLLVIIVLDPDGSYISWMNTSAGWNRF